MLCCVNAMFNCDCVFALCDQHSAGESLYMLFRAIKHQVDKGPVDAVTGKAKYTLNDNRLLREDLEYRTLVRLFLFCFVFLQIFLLYSFCALV